MTSRVTLGLVALVSVAAFTLAVPLAFGSKGGAMPGNAAIGKPVFVQFCGKCHALKAVGAKGTLGPNLDQDKVPYTRIVTAVREGIGGIQAEYTFANRCSPSSSRCLTWNQLYSVAKFVIVARAGGPGTMKYNAGSP
jgi:mono/diheme cytochrome c family protein